MPSNTSDNSSMDQVRELLMGTQLKDMENRLQRQEERFLREIADVRESVKKRTESLENFMKSEASSLLQRLHQEQAERTAALKQENVERAESLKAEQRERVEAMKKDHHEREEAITQLAKELTKKEEAFDRKLATLSNALDTAEQELRKLLLAENVRLSEAIDEKYKDALDALARTAAELRHDLVSRKNLSALFTETAVKLSGDLALVDPPAPTEDAPAPKNKDGKSEKHES